MTERIPGSPANPLAGFDIQAMLGQLGGLSGQSDVLTRRVQGLSGGNLDTVVPQQSDRLQDYDFSGRVVVEEGGGIIGNGAELVTGALGAGNGFAQMQAHRRERWGVSMSDLDPSLPASEQLPADQLDQVTFRMSDDMGDRRIPNFRYQLPNGNYRTVTGEERELSLLDIREGYYHPDENVRQAFREQVRSHFSNEAADHGAQVRVRNETNAEGEQVGDIEFELELNTALREDATVDPDGRGNQQQGGQPRDEREESALVQEAGSTNEEANAELGTAIAALLGGAGGGALLGNYNGRNNFGIGGQLGLSDVGDILSAGGTAMGVSAGLMSMMPSTQLVPFLPGLPTGATGALTIAIEGGARMIGAPGMAFRAREVRETMIQIQKDEFMISNIRNSSIPIEYLLMVIMGHVYDSAEKRMRLKLEEIMVAEQLERRREMREGIGSMLKGAVNFVTGGIGGAVIDGAQSIFNHMDGSLNGQMKSQTVLIQELQFMTQILKQLMELISNMSKNFHDMAMVPVRNLR